MRAPDPRTPSSSRPRWHLLYFVLAGFDLVTISVSLYLNHRLVGIYGESVRVNQEWAKRLTRYSELAEWSRLTNAPGNDVFETHNVEGESAQFRESLKRFNVLLAEARNDLTTNLPQAQSAPMLESLDEVASAMNAHVTEEKKLFLLFGQGESDKAAECMARMDRQHVRLDSILARLREDIGRIQAARFQEQTEWARSLKWIEYAIAVLIATIVSGVTTYGYKLYQQVAATTKALEEQREHETLRAKHMASLAQVATGVAHELRNPLTSIKILVQSNREELESRGAPSEDLYIIEQETRRMERYLRTFLDFARPPKLVPHLISLAELVTRTCALVSDRAAKQQVTITFSTPASPVLVDADWEQIQQLLLNLALNALDAMPHGGVLEFDIRPNSNGQVELRVLDTGPGIDPQLLPQLFEPFVTNKETGVGLGLVVSRRIAEDHHGSLSAENQPGGGACFVLRLPRPEVEHGQVATRIGTAESPVTKTHATQP